MHPSQPPLAYRSPFVLPRPAILVAIATISICYGVLSAVISILSISTDIYRFDETLHPPPPPPRPATVPATAPTILLTSYHSNLKLLIVSMSACVCNFALAVVLIAAGVQTVRNRVVAARLHWIFAIAKLPVVIVTMIVSWMINSGMMEEINAASNAINGYTTMTTTVGPIHVVVFLISAVACGYAIALMSVLSSVRVMWYYDGLRRGTE